MTYDAAMRLADAIEMLADSGADAPGPTTWADLGCGRGTFTLALASLLATGSVIHAMDRDGAALKAIPPAHDGVTIEMHRGDFTEMGWPFGDLTGILMANSLHYIEDQRAFLAACESRMLDSRRFVIVEYDTGDADRWVPYPVSRARLRTLFDPAAYSIRVMRSRASAFGRAPLYSAVMTSRENDLPRRVRANGGDGNVR